MTEAAEVLQKETQQNHMFSSPTMETLTSLTQTGIVEKAARDNLSTGDITQIVGLIEDMQKKHPDYKDHPDPLPEEDLIKVLPDAFSRVRTSFVDRGIIPDALRALISRRLLGDENIRAADDYESVVWFPEHFFPSNPENAALFSMGNKCVAIFEARIARASEKCGISINPEAMQTAAIDTVISHEYGHIIDKTFVILTAYKEKEERGLEKPLYDLPFEEYEEIGEVAHNEIHREVYEHIAPNSGVKKALREDDAALLDSTIDRISTGFEMLGLQFALERKGLSPEDAVKIAQAYRDEQEAYLSDYAVFRNTLDVVSLSPKEAEKGLDRVRSLLTGTANRDDLLPLVSPTGGIGGRKVGYYAPLTEEELKAFVSSNMPRVEAFEK